MARRKRKTTKLDRAKRIVAAMTGRGAQASSTVEAAVTRAGISVRTYRTARKQLGTVAVRKSRHTHRRGSGKWFAKRR